MPGKPEPDYSGKRVLVVGAARSGIASAEFLLARGAHVVLTDVKTEEELAQPLAALRDFARASGELVLETGGHRPESFRSCDLVVVSPGVPLAHPCFDESRRAGVPILAEVELASRHLKGKILGITGSNGKTTTATLADALLRGAGFRSHAAGNIGDALIRLVDASKPEDIYVVELSSFQLEGIERLRPHIASILNLTPDHLDRYRTFADYAGAKQRIFMNQTAEDFAVLNADDPQTASLAAQVAAAPVLFSRQREVGRGVFVRAGRMVYRDGTGESDLFATDAVRLRGTHNLENVLAAATMVLLAGAAPESLAETVLSFFGVEHRLEWVAEIRGVQFFNDSKATNVDAAAKSLEAFPRNIILIAGGRDKGGDFAPLRPLVAERVKQLIVVGEAAGKIREALSDLVETRQAADLPEAVRMAGRKAEPGDVVLLAPACASFDMFQNYEHRGRVFKEAVRKLVTN